MSLFKYIDYKQYIIETIKNRPQKGHGEISRMAESLRVNSTLISQVLADRRDFSLEQAHAVTKFFNLNNIETRYFMQLVHYARAGSDDLKKFHLAEIEQIQNASKDIKNRVVSDLELTDAEKSFIVSSWRPTAVLISTGRDGGVSREEISAELKLTVEELTPILDRLTEIGIVALEEGKYKTGFKRLFLPKNSDFLNRHQINWRLRAIQQIDQVNNDNVTYTSVASISEKDWPELREKMLNFIAEYAKKISESGTEKIVCLNLDYFTLKNN